MDDERVAVFRDVRDADLRGRDKFFMAESEMVIRRLLRTPERVHLPTNPARPLHGEPSSRWVTRLASRHRSG